MIVCDCTNCFPLLKKKTTIRNENAWCKAIIKPLPRKTLDDLIKRLPFDCLMNVLSFLNYRDIETIRATCKSAYLQNFSPIATVSRCCFTDGLIALRNRINPTRVGICPECLSSSIRTEIICKKCAHEIKIKQNYFLVDMRNWWNMDNVISSFWRKREREHLQSWVDVEIGLYFFMLDF